MPAETISVYSTLSKQKQPLTPGPDGRLKIFVCGPTVYDSPHLGHAKTYTQFDFIVKYLRWRGFEVEYVQNITDIDDKIIDRAREQGIGWDELARKFEAIYVEDMEALGNDAVDRYLRASDHLPQIIQQVKTLLDKGFAYQASDGIYYEVAKFDGYGKLSGRTELQEEDAVARIDHSQEKRGWNDFCLWKARKPDEPYWESEFGDGRPGWHIEDTAITETVFGPQYDIHGGAVDLIFPHHEAEIAQMEAASGLEPLVRYWFHTGFLNIDSEKMSKSKGNFMSVREALAKHDRRSLRFLFLSTHYRSAINFSEDTLVQARGAVRRLDDFVATIDRDLDDVDNEEAIADLRRRITEALDDDFAAPRAVAALFEFIKQQNVAGGSGRRVAALLGELNDLFGFFQLEAGALEAEIEALIQQREGLRAEKKFAEADAIRDRLAARGVKLLDTADGVRWQFEEPAAAAAEEA